MKLENKYNQETIISGSFGSLVKILNCSVCETDNLRTAYITGEGDFYYSPAMINWKGRSISGWITCNENIYNFYPSKKANNYKLIEDLHLNSYTVDISDYHLRHQKNRFISFWFAANSYEVLSIHLAKLLDIEDWLDSQGNLLFDESRTFEDLKKLVEVNKIDVIKELLDPQITVVEGLNGYFLSRGKKLVLTAQLGDGVDQPSIWGKVGTPKFLKSWQKQIDESPRSFLNSCNWV